MLYYFYRRGQSFGICIFFWSIEGHRHTVQHTTGSRSFLCDQKEMVVALDSTTDYFSWWRKEQELEQGIGKLQNPRQSHGQSSQKWPQEPKKLTYRQLHGYTNSAPWCTVCVKLSQHCSSFSVINRGPL